MFESPGTTFDTSTSGLQVYADQSTKNFSVINSAFFSRNLWECRSHTFSFQALFISVIYMDLTWMSNKNVINAFPNLKCVPEPFFLEKKHWLLISLRVNI